MGNKYTKAERERIKQLIVRCNIVRLSEHDTLNEIYKELHVNISRGYLLKIRSRLRKDAGDWIDSLTKGKYDYIYEFKQRIDEIHNIAMQRYRLLDDPQVKPYLRNQILTELRNDTLALTDLLQSTPILSGLEIKMNKMKDMENKIHELEQQQQIDREDDNNYNANYSQEIPR